MKIGAVFLCKCLLHLNKFAFMLKINIRNKVKGI